MGSVRLNSAKLQASVGAMANKAAKRGAFTVARRARGSILGQGRMDTLEMIRGFVQEDVTRDPRRPTYRVRNKAKHFPYQELGTPRSAPGVGRIYPKRAKALRFKPKGSGTYVFAKSVRGVKPGNFLRTAVARTTAADFTQPTVEG